MPGRLLSNLAPSRSPSSAASSRNTSIEPLRPSLPSARSSDDRPRSSGTPPLAAVPSHAMDNIKRASISGIAAMRGHSHDKDRDKRKNRTASSPSPALKPVQSPPKNTIELIRESPPSVFFGPPDASSGVLLAGILRVKVVTEPQIVLESMSMRLIARATQKKPVQKDCQQCMHQDTELKTWKFLSERKTLQKGDHSFPCSHLISGKLPATSYGRLGQITYHLEAQARTATGEEMLWHDELSIVRSLAVPSDKQSLRIFPPTPLEAHLSLVPVIHPIGKFNAQFALKGIVARDLPKRPDIHTRWMLRKLTWKLEETERSIAPACSKHFSKVGGPGKGKEWQEERVLARDELFSGWKKDLSGDGAFEMEFPIILAPRDEKHKALCDVETQNGAMRITHSLVIEMVVAEEWQHNTHQSKNGPTGQARVLRCQFGLKVTERAGLGISWDEEEPPMYGDVAQGPPDYSGEFGLSPLSSEVIGEMSARAQREAARVRESEWPQSPPLYGVNSQMDDVNGSLEQVLEGLDLNEDGQRPNTQQYSLDDLEERGRPRDRSWRDQEDDDGQPGSSGENRSQNNLEEGIAETVPVRQSNTQD